MHAYNITINGYTINIVHATMPGEPEGVLVTADSPLDDPGYIAAVKIAQEAFSYFDAHFQIANFSPMSVDRREFDQEHFEILFRLERGIAEGIVEVDASVQRTIEIMRAEYVRRYGKEKPKRKEFEREGFVYLLRSPSGAYKIGRTSNPENRAKTFGVKLPFEVEFIHLIKTSDMYQLERELHARFSGRHINGEWFALTEEDVSAIKAM